VLEQPAVADPKRKGCLIWGAVLGIVVGGMFAAYGLKPILRHYYGETHVAAGETYRGDGKALRVSATAVRGTTVEVTLSITLTEPWRPVAENFQLEIREQGTWLKPEGGPSTTPEGGLENLPIGEEADVVFRYTTVAGATPVALHLGAPRLKMDLPPGAP